MCFYIGIDVSKLHLDISLNDTVFQVTNDLNGLKQFDSLDIYIKTIKRIPMLSAEEELDLARRLYTQGDLIAARRLVLSKQLNRCKRRMMEVLQERHLRLSRKKSRMGSITHGFHFLGINYSPTQRENNTTVTHANDDLIAQNDVVYSLANGGVNSQLIVNRMSQHVLFLIQGHCGKHANKLNIGLLMRSLLAGSEIIFIAG